MRIELRYRSHIFNIGAFSLNFVRPFAKIAWRMVNIANLGRGSIRYEILDTFNRLARFR